MATEVSKPRFVRCPRCRRLLIELPDVPVYRCGGCEAVLQAKSRRANIVETGRGGDHDEDNPPCAISENTSHEEESISSGQEGSSCCKENGDTEAGPTSDCPKSAGQSAVMGEDTVSVASDPQLLLDRSWKLGQHGSVNSNSSYKMGGSAESVAYEEEMVDGEPGNRASNNLCTSIARISHAYDGNVSSGDDISVKHEKYRLLSRRTVRSRKLSSSNSTEDDGEGDFSGLTHRSFARNAAHSPDRDASSGSENLYPLRNHLESDHLSRSPSRDSAFLEDFPCNSPDGIPSNRLGNLPSDQTELLRRADLLRDQLARPYAGEGRGAQRASAAGTRHDSSRPLFSNREPDQVLAPFCNANMSQWRSRAYGQEAAILQYQSSRRPFSGQGNGACLHHHPEGWQTPVNYRPCSSPACFHPSTAASSGCNSTETSDHDQGKLPCKEKRRQPKRRHCRPVSGGAPFVVCASCLELLQLPVDFLVSRRRLHKLRCGACSEVLTFQYHGGHVVPYNGAMDDVSSKHQLPANQSHSSLEEDPVSYSEEYGPPSSATYSTDGEPVPCILRGSQEQKGKGRYRDTTGPPLHHLLGYASARDLIFVPSDEDEATDSIDLSRFHRPDSDFDQGYGGTGRSPLPRERSPVGYSRNHSEIQEEEDVNRVGDATRGSPFRGITRRDDTEELNRGLENMKLRSSTNRRPR